ncbi:antiparallel microtubule cross-linking factor Ase1 [Schizosaccharomyces japonicus yFS275]|uniref:Antiparallel microtubule cross-linking factor Ase1 n=1 Tax=Schizosaccharomyces japonicus (strain yFS275 / FY16936) TaxID=402676 RepID=B6K391_SCHJY|nr:antiparallel microtubule cross-linking factor Ase1 [Schizosaccharomyces japonicus yFS275]EEB07948.1 antiparallel microtubule cross-linking factor Ase1 [Schizosaccharomyces japonicus yFS275]
MNDESDKTSETSVSETSSNTTWVLFRQKVEEHFAKVERLHAVLGTEGDNSSLFELFSTAMKAQLHEMEQYKQTLEDECRQHVESIEFLVNSLKTHKLEDNLEITPPLLQCAGRLTQIENQYLAMYQDKLTDIKEIYDKLEVICTRLGSEFVKPDLDNSFLSDVSDTFTDSLRVRLEEAEKEVISRTEFVRVLESEVLQLWTEFGTELVPGSEYEKLFKRHQDPPEEIPVTEKVIEELVMLKEEVSKERQTRLENIQSMKLEAQKLWTRLEIDFSEFQERLSDENRCDDETVTFWKEQLEKLYELKLRHIPVFIEDARHRIEDLWDTLCYSEEQRHQFLPAFEPAFTEESLVLHEQYLKVLENEVAANKQLLNLVHRFLTLQAEKQELEISANDSSRLTQRGRRDPGRLLREEKMRKRIQRDLPKTQSALVTELRKWERDNGRQFLVNGESLLETLQDAMQPSVYRAAAISGRPKPSVHTTNSSRSSNESAGTPPQQNKQSSSVYSNRRNSGTSKHTLNTPRTPTSPSKTSHSTNRRSLSAGKLPTPKTGVGRRTPSASQVDLNSSALPTTTRSRSATHGSATLSHANTYTPTPMSMSSFRTNLAAKTRPFAVPALTKSTTTSKDSAIPRPHMSPQSKHASLLKSPQQLPNDTTVQSVSEQFRRAGIKDSQLPSYVQDSSPMKLDIMVPSPKTMAPPIMMSGVSPLRKENYSLLSPSERNEHVSSQLLGFGEIQMEDEWGEEGY